MTYELYYWPGIPGRGEFVRLALEEAGADYVDVAREGKAGGADAVARLLDSESVVTPPFAPPFLKHGDLIIGQTANILFYLGGRLGLAPRAEAAKLWTHQLQLTITDFVQEIHDVHHPIAGSLYYEDQKPAANKRARDFRNGRLPKFLDYFESVLARNPKGPAHLVGNRLTYPDLSLFHVVAGLRYAFPRASSRVEQECPRVVALHDSVTARPRIKAYLKSKRHQPFNEHGLFRHYPELDG